MTALLHILENKTTADEASEANTQRKGIEHIDT